MRAEYDGKPWDSDDYSGSSIGFILFGALIIFLVFYLIPSLVSKKRGVSRQNKSTPRTAVHSGGLTICPRCNGAGYLRVERFICPSCSGLGREFDDHFRSKLLSKLKESDILPDFIKNVSQEGLDGYSPLSVFDHMPLSFSLSKDEHLALHRAVVCPHCKGIGSLDTKLCTCFFDENGNYTRHAGYVKK